MIKENFFNKRTARDNENTGRERFFLNDPQEVNTRFSRHFIIKDNGIEMQACNEITAQFLDGLPDEFTYTQLSDRMMAMAQQPCAIPRPG